MGFFNFNNTWVRQCQILSLCETIVPVSVINSSRGLTNEPRDRKPTRKRCDMVGSCNATCNQVSAKFCRISENFRGGCEGDTSLPKMTVQGFGALLSSFLVVVWLVVSGTTENNFPDRGKTVVEYMRSS